MDNNSSSQQKGESQNASQSQNSQQGTQPGKKPYRKFYYRNKKKPFQTDQAQPREIQKVSFHKVSVVVPLFNEEESLRPLYAEIRKAVKSISADYELIFVDDGSTDNSLSIIKDLARTDNKIKYFSFRTNYGKSAALQIGFKNATGEAIITMDADLQDDPSEIPNLLKKLETGYDLVSGWKKKRFDPFIKKYSSRFFNYVTRVMSGVNIHDINCGLKAYRREVVENIIVYGELHRYIPVLAKWKGFTVSEIAVKHHPRRYGKTKFGVSRFFKGFIDLITVTFTTRYAKRPMHLFGMVGIITTLAGLAVSAYLTFEKLFLGTSLSNRPLLFLGILLIIVGVQFFAIGLIGELIVHNTQSDKEYVIKERK